MAENDLGAVAAPANSALGAGGNKIFGIRRRDRRGRGIRGPLMPKSLPAYRTRSGQFDESVAMVVRHLEASWANEIAGTEFAVEEVPVPTPNSNEVPLGRLFPAQGAQPARVVVYRRPIMIRAIDADDLQDLIFDVVVEQVAHLIGLTPEEIDPTYNG